MSAIQTVRNLKRPGSEPNSPKTPRKPSQSANPSSPPTARKHASGSWSDLSASTSSMGMSMSTSGRRVSLAPRTDIDLSHQREMVRKEMEQRRVARAATERVHNTTEALPAAVRARTLVLLVAEARHFQRLKRRSSETTVNAETPRCTIDLCRRDLFQDVVNDINLLMTKPRPTPVVTRRSCGNLTDARDLSYNHTVTELAMLRLWN